MKLKVNQKVLGENTSNKNTLIPKQGYPVVKQTGVMEVDTPLDSKKLGKSFGMRLPNGMHAKLMSQANAVGVSAAEFIRLAVFQPNQRLLRLRLLAHISRALSVISEKSADQVETISLLIEIHRFVEQISEGLKSDRRTK